MKQFLVLSSLLTIFVVCSCSAPSGANEVSEQNKGMPIGVATQQEGVAFAQREKVQAETMATQLQAQNANIIRAKPKQPIKMPKIPTPAAKAAKAQREAVEQKAQVDKQAEQQKMQATIFAAEKKEALEKQTSEQKENMQNFMKSFRDHLQVFHPAFQQYQATQQQDVLSDFIDNQQQRQGLINNINKEALLQKYLQGLDPLYQQYDTSHLSDMVDNYRKMSSLAAQRDQIEQELSNAELTYLNKLKLVMVTQLKQQIANGDSLVQEFESNLQNRLADNKSASGQEQFNMLEASLRDVLTRVFDEANASAEVSLDENSQNQVYSEFQQLSVIYQNCFGSEEENQPGILTTLASAYQNQVQLQEKQFADLGVQIQSIKNQNLAIKKQEQSLIGRASQELAKPASKYSSMRDSKQYNQDEVFSKIKSDLQKQ